MALANAGPLIAENLCKICLELLVYPRFVHKTFMFQGMCHLMNSNIHIIRFVAVPLQKIFPCNINSFWRHMAHKNLRFASFLISRQELRKYF